MFAIGGPLLTVATYARLIHYFLLKTYYKKSRLHPFDKRVAGWFKRMSNIAFVLYIPVLCFYIFGLGLVAFKRLQ
ncbi:hypothetical protein AVT69_gp068 [Pseudomonas phage PhiPA3]|uniref:Uncharacterized protein 069 n=1 Tax=Pseudomonas phage PhiPA3 TaxID=998086 RepID=F8SJU8_BPPA3|nr:hypothetical protein AVT69_gp068 [Pseudomonas phage PhiPA3]AEH03493.1 hypothetical protein [Pseudomonas phage PhiPA3]